MWERMRQIFWKLFLQRWTYTCVAHVYTKCVFVCKVTVYMCIVRSRVGQNVGLIAISHQANVYEILHICLLFPPLMVPLTCLLQNRHAT